MSEPQKYIAHVKRPFWLADRVRDTRSIVSANGVRIDVTRELLGGGVTAVCLDAPASMSASMDNAWPAKELTSGRSPWTRVWAEWAVPDPKLGLVKCGVSITERADPGGLLAYRAQFVWENPRDKTLQLPFRADNGEAQGVRWWVRAHDGRYAQMQDGKALYYSFGYGPTALPLWLQAMLTPWALFLELICHQPFGVGEVSVLRATRRHHRLTDGPPPFVRYTTLTLTLGKSGAVDAAHHAPRGPSGGVRRHAVLGHWAHYGTDGKKLLFGKTMPKNGVVWKPEHERGHYRLGVIAKRYDTRQEKV